MKWLLAVMLVTIAGKAHSEVIAFESAEWANPAIEWQIMGPRFDENRLAWTPINLPHNWFRQVTGVPYGWYRLKIRLDPAPEGGQSLYFPRLRMHHANIFVNRTPIWRLREAYAVGVEVSGLLVRIPAGLLRSGENTILVQVGGRTQWFHGLPRVYLGPTAVLATDAGTRRLIEVHMIQIIAAAFGAIGLLSLWLWLRVERDAVLFWYGISGVMLLAATVLWYGAQWRPDLAGWREALLFMRQHGYLAPFFVLHLRLAGGRHPWLESALWVALAAALLTISQEAVWTTRFHSGALAWLIWGLAFSILPALLVIPLLVSRSLRVRPGVQLLIVADLAASALPLHDWAMRFGYLDYDRPYLVTFAPAFVLLAAAAPIIDRVRSGRRAREEQRLELERRVGEKTREIERGHAQLRETQREQDLANARRRIMADMHDGVGARLVALLSVAQSGKANHGEISAGIAAALDELRLAVDSVQPVEGDISVVLGNVRHRMRSVFERAGVRLVWNVSELPRLESLSPERVLAVQRIFLEAFSNAIRHSGAGTISVSTTSLPGAVRIVIEDDGRGFDPEANRSGTGLGNLRMRAAEANGDIAIDSAPGGGTRVTLTLARNGTRASPGTTKVPG